MLKLLPLILLASLLLGCDQKRLDHKIVTSDFEDSIKLVWRRGADAGSWTYEIPDPAPHGHQAMYALYLYDGNKKHVIIATSSRCELPYQDAGTSHEELSPKTLDGGWFLWIDYELYSSEGELLLKGSKLSEPSPKQTKPPTNQN